MIYTKLKTLIIRIMADSKMTKTNRVESWNNVKNRKSQRDIDAEWDKLFGPKVVREYEEDGLLIKVYESR